MQETDAFLTRTIVGAPCSARLGRRIGAPLAATAGLAVDLHSGQPWITAIADESPAAADSAEPARRPGGLAGWLERHALALALAGMAALAAGAALTWFGLRPWT